MRFLHTRCNEITEFCTENGVNLFVVQSADGILSTRGELREIDALLARSQELWGTTAPFYLALRKSPVPPEYETLADAVAYVETTGGSNDFLLVAYQDGGLISISETKFIFQDNAKAAMWWYPVS